VVLKKTHTVPSMGQKSGLWEQGNPLTLALTPPIGNCRSRKDSVQDVARGPGKSSQKLKKNRSLPQFWPGSPTRFDNSQVYFPAFAGGQTCCKFCFIGIFYIFGSVSRLKITKKKPRNTRYTPEEPPFTSVWRGERQP